MAAAQSTETVQIGPVFNPEGVDSILSISVPVGDTGERILLAQGTGDIDDAGPESLEIFIDGQFVLEMHNENRDPICSGQTTSEFFVRLTDEQYTQFAADGLLEVSIKPATGVNACGSGALLPPTWPSPGAPIPANSDYGFFGLLAPVGGDIVDDVAPSGYSLLLGPQRGFDGSRNRVTLSLEKGEIGALAEMELVSSVGVIVATRVFIIGVFDSEFLLFRDDSIPSQEVSRSGSRIRDLPDDIYTLRARLIDPFDNVGEWVEATAEKDYIGPAVQSFSSTESGRTATQTASYTLVFNEPADGLLDTEIAVTNGTVSNLATTDNITYTLDVTADAEGEVTVQIPANVAQGRGSNQIGNTASETLSFTYDTTPPTPVISTEEPDPTAAEEVEILIDFGEAVTGFALDGSELTLLNATVKNDTITDNGDGTFSATLIPGGMTTLVALINAGVATDLAGNESVATPSAFSLGVNVEPDIQVKDASGAVLSSGATFDAPLLLTGTETSLTFSVENIGSQDLEIFSIGIENDTSTQLLTSSSVSAIVSPLAVGSDAQDFTVTFTPSAAGTVSFDVKITSNDPDASDFIFTVSGTVEDIVRGLEVTYARSSSTLVTLQPDIETRVTTAELPGVLSGELFIPAGAAQDPSGNTSALSSVLSLNADTIAPGIEISAAATTLGLEDTTLVTFLLSEPSTDFAIADIRVTGGSLSEFTGSGAQYTATFTPRIGPTSNAGVATIFVAEGAFTDSFGNLSTASNELELDFGDALVERTTRIVNNYMVRRVDQIISNQPDISGRLNRNGGNASQAGNFNGEGNFSTDNRFGFSTSLRDIAAYQQRDKRAQEALEGAGFEGGFGARPMAQTHGSVPADVWIAGSVARIENESAKSSLGLLFGGIDYAVTEDLVLGVMGQLDWIEEDDDRRESSASGMGWMVGPYFVAELDDSLVVDGRFAWGQSDNTVSPFNTYEDDFDTNRWLVSSKLTGGVQYNDVQLRPQVGLIYFEEKQLAYTDSNGLFIPEQDVALGRLTFSPNFTHSHVTDDAMSVTTNWTVTGIWDFQTADLVNLDSGLIADRDTNIRARTELGLSLRMPNGMSLGADGFYDGIGVSEYRAYGGTIRLSIPLQ